MKVELYDASVWAYASGGSNVHSTQRLHGVGDLFAWLRAYDRPRVYRRRVSVHDPRQAW